MAYKTKMDCLKFSLLAGFLLFFQFTYAQYDFSGVDAILKKSRNAGACPLELV